ncbi:MAG: hypothetical protein ACYC3F_17070, partial [Gemmatimonadaceae bacterium]
MKRSKPLARTSRLARGARIKAVNRRRKASEFTRTYHSRARLRWVKSLPCLACTAIAPLFGMTCGPSDNAHTETAGAGRKADYT